MGLYRESNAAGVGAGWPRPMGRKSGLGACKKNDVKVRKGRLGCRAALGKVRKTSVVDTHCVLSVLDTHSVLLKV